MKHVPVGILVFIIALSVARSIGNISVLISMSKNHVGNTYDKIFTHTHTLTFKVYEEMP